MASPKAKTPPSAPTKWYPRAVIAIDGACGLVVDGVMVVEGVVGVVVEGVVGVVVGGVVIGVVDAAGVGTKARPCGPDNSEPSP